MRSSTIRRPRSARTNWASPRPSARVHPRAYGTFVRVLGRYVRERHRLDLATAVHRMTGLPARDPGAHGAGTRRAGLRGGPRRIRPCDGGRWIDLRRTHCRAPGDRGRADRRWIRDRTRTADRRRARGGPSTVAQWTPPDASIWMISFDDRPAQSVELPTEVRHRTHMVGHDPDPVADRDGGVGGQIEDAVLLGQADQRGLGIDHPTEILSAGCSNERRDPARTSWTRRRSPRDPRPAG